MTPDETNRRTVKLTDRLVRINNFFEAAKITEHRERGLKVEETAVTKAMMWKCVMTCLGTAGRTRIARTQ